MYKKVDEEIERFLCIREETSEWLISDSPTGKAGMIWSGKATNSPFSPEAGKSARYGVTNWRHSEGDGFEEGPIRVACTETIVLSSTEGAAEYVGARLGEYVRAGADFNGRPYYIQRDTEGSQQSYLFYHNDGIWFGGDDLGDITAGGLMIRQDTPLPPKTNWLYANGNEFVEDDTSLKLEFTSLSPCTQGEVTWEGDLDADAEKHSSSLGDYRFAFYPITSFNRDIPSFHSTIFKILYHQAKRNCEMEEFTVIAIVIKTESSDQV